MNSRIHRSGHHGQAHGRQPHQGRAHPVPVQPQRRTAGADSCGRRRPARRARKSRRRPISSSPWCRTRRTSRRRCSARTASPRACARGKIVIDMSSISPIETKAFAERIKQARLRLCGRAGVGRRGWREERGAHHHGRRQRARLREGQAAVRTDGQEHHAGGRQRRRSDLQGRQSDHRRAQHRSRRRSAAVRLQSRRRSGQGAPGADGRLRLLARAGSARGTHDQAHLRSRLPHRAAPEGPEPRAVQRAQAGR